MMLCFIGEEQLATETGPLTLKDSISPLQPSETHAVQRCESHSVLKEDQQLINSLAATWYLLTLIYA